MKYTCVLARLQNDGQILEGARKQTIVHYAGLEVDGLYYLRPGKLYRVVEAEGEEASREASIQHASRSHLRRPGPDR